MYASRKVGKAIYTDKDFSVTITDFSDPNQKTLKSSCISKYQNRLRSQYHADSTLAELRARSDLSDDQKYKI